MHILELFLHFVFYSFLGWVAETIYCSLLQGKFVYRGFLSGPVCPIYGFGAIFVITLLQPFKENILMLFLMGVVITSTLEYITSYLLEVIFHMKWWDYSKRKFNINGRVCAWNSSLFGILSVFAVTKLDPFTSNMVANLSPLAIQVGAVSLFIYFLVDFTMTTYSLLKLKGTMAKIENILDEAKDDFEEAIKNIRVNFLEKRVLKAYPTLISKKYPEGLKKIKTFIKEYVKIDK